MRVSSFFLPLHQNLCNNYLVLGKVQKNRLWSVLSLLCFFLLVFFIFYLRIKSYFSLDIYTQRDIQRAFDWLHGKPYWPGPEMSTGGNLPGPFFYFLLIPPLIFGKTVYSQSVLWFISWLSLSWTVAFYFAGKICKNKESLLIFVLFLISSVGYSLYVPLGVSWNPGFAIMFHVLALMTLYYWKEEERGIYLYGLGLVIGFGIQVHFLVSIHFLTALSFFLFQREKKIRPFLCFITLILIPNLPYFLMHTFDILDTTHYSKDHLLYLRRKIFSEKWFHNINRITSFRNYVIGPLLYLICSNVLFFKRKIFIQKSTTSFLVIIIIPVFTAFLIAKTSWYLIFVPIFLGLLFLKLYDNFKFPNYNFFVCGFLFTLPLLVNFTDSYIYIYIYIYIYESVFSFNFIICLILMFLFLSITKTFSCSALLKCFFFLLVSGTLLTKNHYKGCNQKPIQAAFFHEWLEYHEMKPLFKQIASETSWSPRTAIKRMFLIHGVRLRDSGLFSYYALAKEEFEKESEVSEDQLKTMSKPDGYFIIQHLRRFKGYIRKDWKEYLSSSPYILDIIKNEIKTDKIIINLPGFYRKYWLIPYQTTDQSVFYKGFYNIGQPYYWEEPDWLKNCKLTNHFRKGNQAYYCMVLSGYRQKAGVSINFPKDNKQFLEIGFFGPLLGLKSDFSNFDGFAFWSNIQISLFCNDKEYLYLAPNIGYNPVIRRDNPISIMSKIKELNSPLKLRFSHPCEKVTRIKLNFDHLKRQPFYYPEVAPEKKEIVWEI